MTEHRREIGLTGLVFAIQAVVIATRYAHNIGYSDSLGNMLYSMYGIAQTMGLHRIPPSELDKTDCIKGSPEWFEKIEREVGKRTWWQLVIQDHFSIPFTETYGSLSSSSTQQPYLNM